MSTTSSAVARGSMASNGCSLPIRVFMRSREACEIVILCIGGSSTSRLAGLVSAHCGTKPGRDRAHVRQLGILDRSRRHLYRRDRQAAGRRAGHPQAALGKSRSLSRRRGAWHPPPARAQTRRGNSEPAHRRGQDGHHGRHQCPARAQGRPHLATHHQGLSRRLAHRLPGAAKDLRQAHRQARHAVRARRRGRRAGACRWHRGARARSRRGAGRASPRQTGRRRRRRRRADARLPLHRPRTTGCGAGARARFRPGLRQPRSVAADQAGRPRRHYRRRQLSVADFAAICVAGGWRSAWRRSRRVVRQDAPDVHDVLRRPHRGRIVPRQGCDPVGAGGRRRRHGGDRPRRGVLPADRLRHGRHFDRRVALRRPVRTRLRDRSRRRAHARPDDAYSHGGGRRWLDPAFRRRAVSRRPGFRRRQSGPKVLSPRRTAGGDRRQCDGRQAYCGFLSENLWPRAEPAARCRRGAPGFSGEQVADGFIKIVVENMANAIKKISVQRGYDVTRYALNCFGGAGGQHACLVADALGMESVLIHPLSSLLSAYGMGLADIRSVRQQAIEEPFGDKARAIVQKIAATLARDTIAEVAGQGVAINKITLHVRAHIRYAGTDTPLIVEAGKLHPPLRRRQLDLLPLAKMKSAFERAHKAQFGFIDRSKELVIEAVSVEAVGGGAQFKEPKLKTTRAKLPKPARRTRFFSGGKWQRAPVYTRDLLAPGHKVKGPAIIIEPHQTIVVEHGWQAELTAKNHLVLRRVQKLVRARAIGTKADPVMLEVFNNLFMSIAEQMGVSLQNTAYSVNIKERLDFSCAIFSADGSLVANAPHMPVHRGSMDRAVETIIRENKGRIRPGDVYAINAPYNGGTHLPDITVCTPAFNTSEKKAGEILFWVASRGHHADVGGMSPGSMTPNATEIEQEGVYIDNFKLVERGRFREKETYQLLEGAKYPARNPLQNVNDIKAQIAANEMGVRELRKMVRYFTLPVVRAYMRHVQDNAAVSVRRVIDRLHDSAFAIETDQGSVIKVRIAVDKKKREATVDFTGTSPQQSSNFNAPEPVTRAAVLYVFRVMVDDDIPMNAGCLRPIRIVIPKKSMLTPEFPAAVVAGNVETSQEVTNCLFGALGAM